MCILHIIYIHTYIYTVFTDYVSKLMTETYLALLGETTLPKLKEAPPSMTAVLENKDDAEEVRQRHRSRFAFT